MQIAEQYYLDPSGTLATAVSVARTVADDDENPMHQQAQALIDRWQMDWLIQENHFQAAQRALNLGQLDLALTNAQKITHPHYLEKIKPVIEAVQARRIELENFLEQAQQSLLIGEIERAIYFATKLPDTEPWTTQKAQVLEQAKSIQINRERRWQSVLWLLGLFVVVLSALAGRR
ncbi:MAG: hypothetical protein HC769_20715 [Cyanobacteria bacterium CRU_2_1]|nr:hypothetical protein [Cyanobacteria bacterium RU_5_0]NJR61032.1 hypothetical protein [Cyanobacteria bacterium CRU_2_1]